MRNDCFFRAAWLWNRIGVHMFGMAMVASLVVFVLHFVGAYLVTAFGQMHGGFALGFCVAVPLGLLILPLMLYFCGSYPYIRRGFKFNFKRFVTSSTAIWRVFLFIILSWCLLCATCFYVGFTAATWTRITVFNQVLENPHPMDATDSNSNILYRRWISGRISDVFVDYSVSQRRDSGTLYYITCMYPVFTSTNLTINLVIGCGNSQYNRTITCNRSENAADACFRRVESAQLLGTIANLTSLSRLYANTDFNNPPRLALQDIWHPARHHFIDSFNAANTSWSQGLTLADDFDVVSLMNEVEYNDLEYALAYRAWWYICTIIFAILVFASCGLCGLCCCAYPDFIDAQELRKSAYDWTDIVGKGETDVYQRAEKAAFVWKLHSRVVPDGPKTNETEKRMPQPSKLSYLPPEIIYHICQFVSPPKSAKYTEDHFLLLENLPLLDKDRKRNRTTDHIDLEFQRLIEQAKVN
eukprot:TRINITY_DN2088_c0_g1_i1.p1 TRINITY_DN2088_c0_g1~~TRINITY_DN2088_c0_g1_i1.p1  ORF type:complete len:469 (+),score=27.18 TRINITY_DN2088_c0_g1_i1:62-1468(+)